MSSSTTLYERLGGAAGIESLVSVFYDRVMRDEELAPFFKDAPIREQGTGEAEAREVIGRINPFANEITGTSY